MERLGIILILSGPSGSGKSTIVKQVMAEYPQLTFSVSCTTRQPRPGETDGKSYYFISQEEFDKGVREDRFIEHASVHGNRYGTLKSEVLNRITAGVDVVLDIDVQGAASVRKLCRTEELFARAAEFVFLAPPSPEVLEKRLRDRGTETEESILRRTAAAREEMTHIPEYDYLIVNDRLEQAVADLKSLYRSFGLATKRRKNER